MPRKQNEFFQFNYVPYPLWRRRLLTPLKPLVGPLLRRVYPVTEDTHPPTTAAQMVDFLSRFGLSPIYDADAIRAAVQASIDHDAPRIDTVPGDQLPQTHTGKVRLPAQWESLEAVVLNWPVIYPQLWAQYAQMVAAIAPVAEVAVTVPAEMWAHGIGVYLDLVANLPPDSRQNLRFAILPTDDIWVRDYGPFVSYNGTERVVVDAIYDHHPAYPQGKDNAMPSAWAAHTNSPLLPMNLHIEGGNLLSDGAGTLFTTMRTLQANPHHDAASLEAYLHTIFDFERLIVTPRLPVENTGHIDLLLKPIAVDKLLVSAPNGWSGGRLHDIHAYLRGLRALNGNRYTLIELPTPRPYLNWFIYPIFRSYTNALLVNKRVLVPVYGLPSDDIALRVYADALPDYSVHPIDLVIGINGGGAVHCMTREIPASLG